MTRWVGVWLAAEAEVESSWTSANRDVATTATEITLARVRMDYLPQ
jgi:hypothetical protein